MEGEVQETGKGDCKGAAAGGGGGGGRRGGGGSDRV